jgi:hypothetical protein
MNRSKTFLIKHVLVQVPYVSMTNLTLFQNLYQDIFVSGSQTMDGWLSYLFLDHEFVDVLESAGYLLVLNHKHNTQLHYLTCIQYNAMRLHNSLLTNVL